MAECARKSKKWEYMIQKSQCFRNLNKYSRLKLVRVDESQFERGKIIECTCEICQFGLKLRKCC